MADVVPVAVALAVAVAVQYASDVMQGQRGCQELGDGVAKHCHLGTGQFKATGFKYQVYTAA